MTKPDLGPAGERIWSSAVEALPEGMRFGPHELSLLELAAHQADDLALLEAAIASNGAVLTGASGQPVLNAALSEARQARAAIARIIRQLNIDGSSTDRARSAANARWSGHGPAKSRA